MADDRMTPGPDADPTLVRNQPALHTARRSWWLIPGAILAAVAVTMLALTLQLQQVVPTIGIVLVVGCFLAMLVVAATVTVPRRRDLAFAWLMAAMAVAAVGSLSLVVAVEAGWA